MSTPQGRIPQFRSPQPSTSTVTIRPLQPVAQEATAVRNLPTKKPPPDVTKDELARAGFRILQAGGSEQDVYKYWDDVYGLRAPGYQPVPRTETPGMLRGLSMNALQGLTFGFGDEAMGRIYELIGVEDGTDEYRRELAQFNAAHQVAGAPDPGTLAEIGGSMLWFGAPLAGRGLRQLGGRMATMGTAGRVATGLGAGAATGAAMGAGTAEGGLSERARGAILGVPLGTVGTGIGMGGVAVAKPLARALTSAAGSAGEAIEPLVRGAGQRMEPVSARAGQVTGNVADWLARPAPTTPSLHARRALADAVIADHGSLDDAIRFVSRQSPDVPLAVADLGEHTGAVVEAAARLRPPGTQQAIESVLLRGEQGGDRIISKLARASKLGAENAYDTAEELVANRAAAAARDYTAAHTQRTKVTPRLRQLLQQPQWQRVYERGREIARAEDTMPGVAHPGALSVPSLESPAVPASTILTPRGVPARAAVPPRIPDELPIRGLDYMKRGLDQIIDESGQPGKPTLDRQLARAMRATLNLALDEIDSVDYRRARAVFRGHSEALDALQLGKGGPALVEGKHVRTPRFINKPPEVITRELRDLSSAEREFYRNGILQDVAEYVREIQSGQQQLTPTQVRRLAARLQPRVRAAFPDAADEVLDLLRSELSVSRTGERFARVQRVPAGEAAAALELTGEALPVRRGVRSTLVATAGAALEAVASQRTAWSEAVSNEVTSLATRGLRGRDELIATLYGLKPIPPGQLRSAFRLAAPLVAGPQAEQTGSTFVGR